MATVATMSAIDALNQFGRNPSRPLTTDTDTTTMTTTADDYDDLEEDETFFLGPTKSANTVAAGSTETEAEAPFVKAEPVEMELEEDETFFDSSAHLASIHNRDISDTSDREDTPPFPGTLVVPSSPPSPPPAAAADDNDDREETPPFSLPAFARQTREDEDEQAAVHDNVAADDDFEEDPTSFNPPPQSSSSSAFNTNADQQGNRYQSSIPPSSPTRLSLSSPRIKNAQQDRDGSVELDESDATAPPPSTATAPHANPNNRSRLADLGLPDFDATRVDLGRHTSSTREVSATTYSGRRIRFKRQQGHALVGESAYPESSTIGIRTNASTSTSADGKTPAALGRLAMSMLEKPIHVLLEEIEQAKKKRDAEKKEQTIHDNLLEAYGHSTKTHGAAAANKGKGKQRQQHGGGDTWTDRYKPKTFTELLGDERTHRQAMSWLKEWDSCVFKTTNHAAVARKKHLKRARDALTAANGYTSNASAADMENDDALGRPKDKILLLTGPPGLGKTTLAHVIATQAGYRVSEINASDDRSAKVVHDRIRQSLESTTITSLGSLSSSKPTCLVIDEIDGAAGGDAGFIKTLVKLVMDGSKTNKANYSSTNGSGGSKKQKKDAMPPLQRPIICICNDLYVPALRPLRAIARIVRFHPPTNGMLVKRLRDICDKEQLKTDHKGLTTLVEVAEGDMRSCLNTLQIVRAQSTTLDVNVLRSTALGLKDTQTSVTAVWDKLFKVPTKKRQKGLEQHAEGKYVAPLVKDITTCGEYDKLAQTCFENYLKGKTPADELRAATKALDWLQFYDSLNARMRSEREYDVLPYIPYTFVPWNPIFAAVSNKTPEWPRIDYEMHLKRTAHQEVADMLIKNLPMHIKGFFTGHNIVAELAPLLLRIITPDLKPVNQQLIRAEDRQALKKLIGAMIDLGISYVQDRNEEGQVVYKLDPPIDIFTHYEGKRAGDLPAARFNLRQLVSKELDAELVRRAGGSTDSNGKSSSKNVSDIMQAYKSTKGDAVVDKPAAAAVDFFGRPVTLKAAVLPADGDNDENSAPIALPPTKRVKVFYKYHEGFSNAVRTNVKVTELFR